MKCLKCLTEIEKKVSWRSLVHHKDLSYCVECKPKLEKLTGCLCPTCGKEMTEATLCKDCIERKTSAILYNRSLYRYNEESKALIALCKYQYHYHALTPFASEINQCFSASFRGVKKLTLIPIPLSEEGMSERLFNQTELIASMIKRPRQSILKRYHADKQALKTRKERLASNNPFYIDEDINQLKGAVVLIDDVYTTGTTIHHAANVLEKHGVTDIYSFTLAR